MKKRSFTEKFTIFTIICSIAVVGIYIYLIISSYNDDSTSLADGFNISAYYIVLDVNEDNTIDVTENITINFTSNLKHGIYRDIPEWLEYTGKDGKTIKRKSLVENLSVVGDDYFIDKVNKKIRIKVGSASEYVSRGEKTYVIKYTYNMGSDPYDEFDEFIFHAFGDYWGTEIKNATVVINMPQNIDNASINFFFDKYRENSANDYVNYTINGNTIYASFDRDKYYKESGERLTKSLTIDIELPEGYFTGGTWNYGWISFILCMIVLVITLWNLFNWKRYGKDYSKTSQTVEFYPPENFDAAEIGYIYSKQSNKKLVISIILELACMGYIKIDEVEESGEQEIQITNLKEKPLNGYTFDTGLPERVIRVRKIKELDKSILDDKEINLMNYLFKDSNEKEVASMDLEIFLQKKDSLIKKGFIEIVFDNEKTRYEEHSKWQAEYKKYIEDYKNSLVNFKSNNIQRYDLDALQLTVYNKLFEKEDKIILSEHRTLYTAFAEVEKLLDENLKDLVDDKKSKKKMLESMVISLIALVLPLLSYYLIEDLDPSWSILYYLSFMCIPLNIFLTFIMRRRTMYGEKIIAKIKGFRNFLETVEKDKLEALVEENPSYFYNILPYTYVLNISKKWIEKFENINIPHVDMGNFDFNDIVSFSNLCNNVHIPMPSNNSLSGIDFVSIDSGGSSGGGSFHGGGCSSCGGGGSW